MLCGARWIEATRSQDGKNCKIQQRQPESEEAEKGGRRAEQELTLSRMFATIRLVD